MGWGLLVRSGARAAEVVEVDEGEGCGGAGSDPGEQGVPDHLAEGRGEERDGDQDEVDQDEVDQDSVVRSATSS